MDLQLFCLPFAGGSKYSYNYYLDSAPDFIEMIPLDLPGRGSRVREKLLKDVPSMVNDIFYQIEDKLYRPYAIYGHSMGGLLGYLLTKAIIKRQLPPPLHLFVTGRGGPSVKNEEPPYHTLPYDEFILKLKEMQGSPEQILNDSPSMEFFEPIIRADFCSLANFEYESSEPFDVPITCMFGNDEKVTRDEAMAWQLETTAKVNIQEFPGEHFFIFQHGREVLGIIETSLVSALRT